MEAEILLGEKHGIYQSRVRSDAHTENQSNAGAFHVAIL